MKRELGFFRSVWRNRTGRRDLPRMLTYVVTFACNARCIMCDSWKKTPEDDLELSEIESIFRQLPTMDAVRLSGGEPFVRRDLPEIAELVRVHLKPRFLHITTNAFLPERVISFAEERVKDRPLHLLISIDGVEEKHVQVRGRRYAWDRVMETLNALAPRRDELNLRLAVNQTVVDAEGLEHYSKLRDLLAPMGVHNHFIMGYDVSATYSTEQVVDHAPSQIGEFATFGEFSREQLERTLAEVEKDLESYPRAERMAKRYYLRGLKERLLGGEIRTNPKCVALNSHMRLYPNGDVPVCQFNSKRVGNLREKSFHDVWFGEEAVAQRDWVIGCPGCWAECEVLPSAIYTADLIKPAALSRKVAAVKPMIFDRPASVDV